MEQNRAPTVLPHLDELARSTPHQSRSYRADHRRNHHPNRPDGPRRTRHRQLPHRNQDPRLNDDSARRIRCPDPTPMAPRLELHPDTHPNLSVLIIGKPLRALFQEKMAADESVLVAAASFMTWALR